MRAIPFVAATFFAAAMLFSACTSEEKRYVPNVGDGYTTPTMATSDVATFISDSGYTRYRLDTPLWQMFEDAEEPFWKFPDGLAMEQYDLTMTPVSNVICDSALYYSRKKLWQLDGNVLMVNTDADSFMTQQLFWDQNKRIIRSDSFIHIVRSDRVIEGYGFESDQSMKYYTVLKPTAILPVERRAAAKDSTADSCAAAPQRTPQYRQRPAAEHTQTPAAAKPTQEELPAQQFKPDNTLKRSRSVK